MKCLAELLHRLTEYVRTGWEGAMAHALKGIRSQEASHAVQMARIRACNMALFFFIMPVSSFVLFATVSAPTRSSRLL